MDLATIEWIKAMQITRRVMALLGDTKVTVGATRKEDAREVGFYHLCCGHWLWMHLLFRLATNVQEYADVLMIMVRGKHESTLCELMQRTLDLVWSWCKKVGLSISINPGKTIVVSFTRKRNFKLDTLALGQTATDYVKEVKYTGIIYDQKHTWSPQEERVLHRAIGALQVEHQLYSKNSDLKHGFVVI